MSLICDHNAPRLHSKFQAYATARRIQDLVGLLTFSAWIVTQKSGQISRVVNVLPLIPAQL